MTAEKGHSPSIEMGVEARRQTQEVLEQVGIEQRVLLSVPAELANNQTRLERLGLLATSIQQEVVGPFLTGSVDVAARKARDRAELSVRAQRESGWLLRIPHALEPGRQISASTYGVLVAYQLFPNVEGAAQATYVVEVPPVLGVQEDKAFVVKQGKLGMVN